MNLHKNFEVKQSGELKTLEIYLYDDIKADYYDWWLGKIIESTTSANYVRKAISEAGKVDLINVYINSCGGSVSEGNAIFNILKRADAVVNVYIDAFAFSVASVIAMAGDKIVMPSNASMMIHNAMMDAFGNSKELRKAADDLDVMNEASCNSYLIKAGDKISRAELNEMLDAETFLTAEKAFAIGLCDEIANPVDLFSTSVEVIEQARKNNNPNAKKAFEILQSNAKSPTPQPEQKSEPKQEEDKFDWLKKIVNSRNLI